ncbi:MAG: hypothetical protein V4530_12315 [Pseudomonadota bacterium]
MRRLLIAALPLSMAGVANAKTDLTVNGSASVRASQNPYLDNTGNSQSTVSLVGVLSPTLTISDAESQLNIGGSVQHIEYNRLYPSSDSVSANASGNWRFSPKWTATASLGYDDSIVGENGFFDFGRFNDDGTRPPPTADDLTLAGRRIKRRSFSTQAGLNYQPNVRETVNFSLFANETRTLATIDTENYATYGNTFGYSRQVSRRTSIGFTNTALRYECRSQTRCFTNSLQPQLTFSTTLGRDWTLSGSAGASFSQVRLPSQTADNVRPAGSATLCRRQTRMDICLTASQTIETTVGSGARPTLALTSSINYRLDQKSSLGFTAGYTRSAGSALNQDDYDYLSARIFGSRSIARNVSFTVDGGYDRSANPFFGTRSNFSVSMGLSFSLGRTL